MKKTRIGLSEHFDYKKLLKFTFPSIIMMIFTSLYGIVDGLFVANVAGEDAFVAVNLIMPLPMVLGSVGFMIGTGGSALVSQQLGEEKRREANESFSLLIVALVVFGVAVGILGIVFVRPLARLFGAEGKVADDCAAYGGWLFVFFTFFLLQNAFQSFFVVAERPKVGLAISLAAGFTNMFFDFLFVYVFRGGVVGAAIATGLSQLVGGALPFFFFVRRKQKPKAESEARDKSFALSDNKKSADNADNTRSTEAAAEEGKEPERGVDLFLVRPRLRWRILGKCCVNGSSEMMTNVSLSLVNILFNVRLMKLFGNGGVAAYGVLMYTSLVFLGAFIGYSIGVAPIVGYHYGAKNRAELKNVFKRSLVLTGIGAVVFTAAGIFLARPLALLFVGYSTETVELTTFALRIFALSFAFAGFNIFGSAFFTALGNGLVSALISFLRTLLFQVAMIFLLPALFGADAVWAAVAAAEVLTLVVTVVSFILERKRYGY